MATGARLAYSAAPQASITTCRRRWTCPWILGDRTWRSRPTAARHRRHRRRSRSPGTQARPAATGSPRRWKWRSPTGPALAGSGPSWTSTATTRACTTRRAPSSSSTTEEETCATATGSVYVQSFSFRNSRDRPHAFRPNRVRVIPLPLLSDDDIPSSDRPVSSPSFFGPRPTSRISIPARSYCTSFIFSLLSPPSPNGSRPPDRLSNLVRSDPIPRRQGCTQFFFFWEMFIGIETHLNRLTVSSVNLVLFV